MRVTSFLVVMAVAASLAFPASAQRVAAERHKKDAAQALDADKADPDEVAWTYAGCLVDRVAHRAHQVLAEYPNSDNSNQYLVKMQFASCLTRIMDSSYELRFKPALMRGFLAEHLLTKNFDPSTGERLGEEGKIYDQTSQEVLSESTASRTDMALIGAAECAVKASPAAARSLFGTKPASPEERQAIGEVIPHLSSCLDEGLEINFSAAMFRAYLAEAAYRASVKQARSVLVEAAS